MAFGPMRKEKDATKIEEGSISQINVYGLESTSSFILRDRVWAVSNKASEEGPRTRSRERST